MLIALSAPSVLSLNQPHASGYRSLARTNPAPPAATVPEILEDARSMIAGAEQG